MDTGELRRALETAGLTGYEAEAYLTLVEYGQLPAVDVAKKSSIPTSQVYDTLRSLEEQGFVETIELDRLHAEPKAPDEILSELRSRSELLTDAADDLEDRWEQPDIDEHRVGVVKRQETVLERVRARLAQAEVSAELSLTFDQLEFFAAELLAAAERGVLIRALVYDEPDVRAKCEALGLDDSAVKLKVGTIPGPFVAIVDRRQTFFAPNMRADESYGILINDDILSFITHWYFESCQWHGWPPLFEPDEHWSDYASLKAFMRDVIPLYDAGADVTITVRGVDVNTRDPRTEQGRIVEFYYPSRYPHPDQHLSLENLANYSTIYLDTGEQVISVGAWGAVFEDLEAHRISIESVEFALEAGGESGEESA